MADLQGIERHPSLDDRYDAGYRVVDYDETWPHAAATEIERVGSRARGLAVRIEHIGSTSVPGLAAKPIIDLQLALGSLERFAELRDRLEGLGYAYISDPESPDYLFFARPPERPRTHHLHVCEADSTQEIRHLAVRDYLRAHGDQAAEYGELKRRLASTHPRDRLAYVAGKDEFVKELQARALAWRCTR